MDTPVIDQAKLEAFAMRAIGDLTAGYGGVMVSLGSKLGLYKAMAGAGPLSAKELAARAGCAERYVREWLNAQAAGGYVGYHAVSDTYELSPEQAMVLADEDSPVFIPHAWNVPASMWFDEEKALEAFRTGRGVAWGEHDGRLSCGVAAFYRNGYRASLVPQWLPALDGVVEQLEAGIDVADVGCGHGHSTLLMAEAFPQLALPRLRHARRRRSTRRGATRPRRASPTRVDFDVARAVDYPDRHYGLDLLLRLPARPGRSGRRGAARGRGAGARRHGDAGRAVRQRPGRGQPLAGRRSSTTRPRPRSAARTRSRRAASSCSARRPGEARLAEVFRKAGFTHFRRAAETPFNLILEARR